MLLSFIKEFMSAKMLKRRLLIPFARTLLPLRADQLILTATVPPLPVASLEMISTATVHQSLL